MRIMKLATKDHKDPTSAFQWARVHCNSPTAKNYDCSLPQVLLIRDDEELATRQVSYVDDHRVAGREEVPTKIAYHQVQTRMNSHGNQADGRKYRPPMLVPGAWRGDIIHMNTPFHMKSNTGKKWTKFRDALKWVSQKAEAGEVAIDTAVLRMTAGLGVHVTEVYSEGRCFLKGFFNALEAF